MNVFKRNGYTLIELMITLALAGILLAWAAPGFYDMVQSNRSATFTNEFISSLQLTRSEAVRRGATVNMCPSADTSNTSCSGGTNWSNGWIVFADSNDNGQIDAGEERIQIYQLLEANRRVTTGVDNISFAGTGFLQSNSGTFTLDANGCKGNNARSVSLSSTGRIAVTVTACS